MRSDTKARRLRGLESHAAYIRKCGLEGILAAGWDEEFDQYQVFRKDKMVYAGLNVTAFVEGVLLGLAVADFAVTA